MSRTRIEHQRRQHRPAPEQTSTEAATDNNIIAAITAEIARLKAKHRTEVAALRQVLEQAHGENLELRRQPARAGTTADDHSQPAAI